MISPLARVKNSKRELTEKDLKEIHHNLMMVYGWIPLKEFKELPLTTLFGLHNKALKEINKREELRIYTLKFYGVKNIK